MSIKLFNLYEELKKDGIIFCFSGAISQGIVEGIGETVRQKMELEEMRMGTIQKVFGILVEQMQNIINYSAEKTPPCGAVEGGELRFGILIVGRAGETFYIRCGNYVDKDQAEGLKERLHRLQGMNREELKAFYKERRKAGPAPGGKGAGLGLIEMARKAAGPLEFEITEVDGEQPFFSIKVAIAGE